MNVELLRRKIDKFFAETAPEEMVKHFEAMGYSFSDTDEPAAPASSLPEGEQRFTKEDMEEAFEAGREYENTCEFGETWALVNFDKWLQEFKTVKQ